MPCATPSNCQPCSSCGQTPAPVLPACNVLLTDGAYTNATIVVDNGCIVSIQTGEALLYQPDICCAAPGSGGGDGDGLDGDQGPPGESATVSVGTVTSLPFGATPTVVNTGSSSNAVFNFGIPRGEPGEDGETPTGATSSLGGIELQDGSIKDPLPLAWPPVLTVDFAASPVIGVAFNTVKNTADGSYTLTVDLSGYATAVQSQIDAVDNAITVLSAQINRLESFTVAGVPSAAGLAGQMVFITNESGGATPAFSDGATWRRVSDLAVIS